ncbi:DNA polymerase III subunit beta [Labilibaculum sp. A4]|uniref:Beta sliding clamp n=1 Tax=Labilibaculum euxinus TaxID=2686357 RepID=A0A425YE35_9BACT|nr:DNA polymerase III subunit beta [Labilibaculum euxinus]MDQ1770716.1 DNA polymerase III subunit beta [Labilibaculum euxinus]MUP37180.1 DNA polymerase III subunit beta [Labilibaculum euxinus]MVB06385.1 DNA polymerase III subunit beta [Labilibaculum euxinus]MWN75887.1 DNA polymerase III subunit beta [Labilibaculum euxinus]
MKFVVSSTELLSHLQAISRVISSKNTLPILDNFLFELKNDQLVATASDLESTLITTIPLETSVGEGVIAFPAKILTDTLKEFPEQPLTFDIDLTSLAVKITSENGVFSIVGQNGEDFPKLPAKQETNLVNISVEGSVLLTGINKTLFATADDELRPVMNGIFVELGNNDLTFVASDAHKLVRYKRLDGRSEVESSFILPKKPASLLRNILPKETNPVRVEFDEKNAFFTLSNYKLICRLVEGNYPSYNSVIPKTNPNKLTIDRVELYNTLRRVSVFSNPASNLIKFELKANELVVSAQDIDFSISARERLQCQYEGQDLEIGFKSVFLLEILSNISSSNVMVELSDPTRAGIFLPYDNDNADEDVLMLLMPMMINA